MPQNNSGQRTQQILQQPSLTRYNTTYNKALKEEYK